MSQSKNNNKTCTKEIKENSIGGLFFCAHTQAHAYTMRYELQRNNGNALFATAIACQMESVKGRTMSARAFGLCKLI